MWFFELKVLPKPNTDLAKEAAGAFANCWIDFREREGAEQLARFYLGQEGWDYEETTEATWVEKEDYADNREGLQCFLEAQIESACFVVHQWPINGEGEGE